MTETITIKSDCIYPLPAPASSAANTDLSNLSNGLANTICTTPATTTSTATSARPAVVIQNYKSGNNWYRKWSDGWIEQGGYATTPSTGGFFTINLNKAFSTTNYQIIANSVSDASVSQYYPYAQLTGRTTSSFKAAFYPNNAFYWYAYGY